MSEEFRMTVIDGIRYRPEDAPEKPEPELEPEPEPESEPEIEETKPKSRRGRKA
ncbi:MAG: hypothetical protein SO053_01195 [Bifidobacterium animalis]|nr:hypothetical protein [Bifidobacterium animalis]MDY5039760.1 hypothetical protein [Bifidobacterium animalis]